MFKYLFLFSLLVFILIVETGCSSGSGGTNAANSKELFSSWSTSDGTVLDISGLSFASTSIEIKVAANASCICDINFNGDQSQGDINMGSCFWTGSTQPRCSSYAYHGFTYLNINSTLTLCRTVDNSCITYN